MLFLLSNSNTKKSDCAEMKLHLFEGLNIQFSVGRKSLNNHNVRGKHHLDSLRQYNDQENNLIQVYQQQVILATSQIRKKIFRNSITFVRLKHTITQDGTF